MTNPKHLRPLIRDLMRAAPKKKWTPLAFLAAVADIHPDAVLSDVEAAITWNASKAYIDFTKDAESGVTFWSLTPDGKKKK